MRQKNYTNDDDMKIREELNDHIKRKQCWCNFE